MPWTLVRSPLWSDVDLQGRALTVRETKNEDDRMIPLSNAAHQIHVQRRNDWEIERRQALIVAPFVYGTLADIRQVMVRAMKRLNFDSARLTWLRPIHSLRDTFILDGLFLRSAGEPTDDPAYS